MDRPRCPECNRLLRRHCKNPHCAWVRCPDRRADRNASCGYGQLAATGFLDKWVSWKMREIPPPNASGHFLGGGSDPTR